MALYYFVRRFKKFQKIDKETICTFEYNFLNAALFKEFWINPKEDTCLHTKALKTNPVKEIARRSLIKWMKYVGKRIKYI